MDPLVFLFLCLSQAPNSDMLAGLEGNWISQIDRLVKNAETNRWYTRSMPPVLYINQYPPKAKNALLDRSRSPKNQKSRQRSQINWIIIIRKLYSFVVNKVFTVKFFDVIFINCQLCLFTFKLHLACYARQVHF